MVLHAVPLSAAISIEQACAVPFRVKRGRIEYCLITASSGRWQFPKGYVDEGETYAEAALKEALEEAGLRGRVLGEPMGCYEISKKGRPCTVIALLMQVDRCDADWEEAASRRRKWVSLKDARRLLTEQTPAAEPALVELLEIARQRTAQDTDQAPRRDVG